MKKTQRVKPANRRLFLESLERREVLAGNITVTLSQGLLTVVGDDNSNQIGIYQQANGRFNVVALDGEEITGPTEDLIVRNIAVGMWAGDDFVQISAQPEEGEMLPTAAEVLGSVKVRGGDGDDILRVSVVGRQVGTFVLPSLSVGIEGDLVPPTNVGEVIVEQDDEVGVFNTITGNLTVNTQGGDDMIDLINVSAAEREREFHHFGQYWHDRQRHRDHVGRQCVECQCELGNFLCRRRWRQFIVCRQCHLWYRDIERRQRARLCERL